jgi:hypothetical protein
MFRYGDILYTMGGPSNLRVARAYYSKALELTRGTSCRALWGIAACCANATDKVSSKVIIAVLAQPTFDTGTYASTIHDDDIAVAQYQAC